MTVGTITVRTADLPQGGLFGPCAEIPEVREGKPKFHSEIAEGNARALEHISLVKTIVSRIGAHLPPMVDRDDLMQAGMLGLLDAARKFDEGKHASFPTYAKYRIRGAILDSLRNLDDAPRDLRKSQKQVESANGNLMTKLQRTPTEVELARELGMDLAELRKKMVFIKNLPRVSKSGMREQDEDIRLQEIPAGLEGLPDAICARKERIDVVNKAVRTLPLRHRQVIRLYYGDEMTMRNIGRRLRINESRVSQIHKAALARMAAVLTVKLKSSRDV